MPDHEIPLPDLIEGRDFPVGDDIHTVTIPGARRVRLVGLFFDLNKSFLLPSALRGIKSMKALYEENPDTDLLVVGHTDTSGGEEANGQLSLERAEAVASYLQDDIDAWDLFFTTAKPLEKRWGTREVQYMLSVLPQGGEPFYGGEVNGLNDFRTQAAVTAFQASKGLEVDGIVGPKTRRALIEDYMAFDDTTLPAGISITPHGCGEAFPAEETGDGVQDADNRRVEMFFFDNGIDPPPSGKISKKGSTEYPKWVEQTSETLDLSGGDGPEAGPAVLIGLHPPDIEAIPDGAQVTFVPDAGDAVTIPFNKALNLGDGLLHFRVPDPQPGVLYKAKVRWESEAPEGLLFEDYELHAILAASQGEGSPPEIVLGRDAMAAAVETDNGATQVLAGGPEETGDERFADLGPTSDSGVAIA